MSNSDLLSNVEMDTLLQSVNDGKVETDNTTKENNSVKKFDLINQIQTVKGSMPNLDIIINRIASHFQVSVSDFLKQPAKVSHSEIQILKYSDFLQDLDSPCYFDIVKFLPLHGEAAIVVEPSLVFTAVDRFFGGNNNDHDYYDKINKQEFSIIELRVIKLLMNLLFKDIEKSWNPVLDVNLETINSEVNPHFVTIAEASENVVISTLKIELGGKSGNISIVMPYFMLDPIRNSLDTIKKTRRTIDKAWQTSFRKEVLRSEILINSMLLEKIISVQDVMNFKEGDIIPINMPENVVVNADNIAIFSGKVGISNGNYAVKITEKINQNLV